MNRQTLVLIAAFLAILGSLVSLYFTQRDPGIELKPYQALGAVAAEETAKLLGGKARVAVIAADLSNYKNLAPMMEAKIKFFQKALKRQGGLTLAAIERVRIQPPSLARTGEFIASDQLTQILEKKPPADAIVSFVGLAPLSSQEISALKRHAPKLVVASGYDSTYKKLLEDRVISLAIVPRTENPPETGERTLTLREWFDREYEIVTPLKSADLP